MTSHARVRRVGLSARVAARVAAGAAALVAALLAATPMTAHAVTPTGAGAITMASQTPWVDPTKNATFDLQVDVRAPGPQEQVQVVVSIYPRLQNRSELTRTLADTYSNYIIAQPVVSTLAALHPAAGGRLDLRIPISDGHSAGFHPPGSGVYPVAVELRPRSGGPPMARLITHLLYTAAPVTGPPLQVVWVVPIHSPPRTDRSAALAALVGSIARYPAVPASLEVTPDTLAGLRTSDPALVTTLGKSLQGREVLAQTWVPMSTPAMLQNGLSDQVLLSLARGGDELGDDLATKVTGRTWVQDGPIDLATLAFLRGAQFDRVVLPEGDLDPNPLRFTVAQPFEVAGEDRTPIRAAVADAGLQAHFTNGGDQVLAAHQLLADLTQIYGDAPSNHRGVVIVTPRSWQPTAAFVNAFLDGLTSSPLLSGTSLDSFFDSVPPAVGAGGRQLVRQVVTDQAAIRTAAVDLLPDKLAAARQTLDALASALPDDTTTFPALERLLLEAPADDLAVADRRALLNDLNARVGTVLHQVQIGGPRTITLTARKGRLPLSIVSAEDTAMRVVLQVQSDKLQFPGQGSSGRAFFNEVLHKGNNALPDLVVEARTSGRFPLTITLLTPTRGLVIGKATFTVQSTVLSGVGVFLSVGAGVFLLLWWGRHAWHTRRAHSPRRRHARGSHGRLAEGT